MATALTFDYRVGEQAFFAGLLHRMALATKAAIDAIPVEAELEYEFEAIEKASAPTALLAELILQMPDMNKSAMSRAEAWLDGKYFTFYKEAA